MTPTNPLDPPLHGYRGVATPPPVMTRPAGLTVTVSRQAGSRGGTIAEAVGQRLGWQVFTQEMLDFLALDPAGHAELSADLPATARLWAAGAAAQFVAGRSPSAEVAAVARLVFTLAARGQSVLVGRGAGFLLPAESTVAVRVVAPTPRRVKYLAQRFRLTEPEAVAEVDARDRRRAAFLAELVDRDVADPVGYDLTLNSDRLGVDRCAELIVQTVRTKQPDGES
ncbi:MAG: cytidylate kinase-like family protein [Gemmataceae bacterium]